MAFAKVIHAVQELCAKKYQLVINAPAHLFALPETMIHAMDVFALEMLSHRVLHIVVDKMPSVESVMLAIRMCLNVIVHRRIHLEIPMIDVSALFYFKN